MCVFLQTNISFENTLPETNIIPPFEKGTFFFKRTLVGDMGQFPGGYKIMQNQSSSTKLGRFYQLKKVGAHNSTFWGLFSPAYRLKKGNFLRGPITTPFITIGSGPTLIASLLDRIGFQARHIRQATLF